MSANYNYRYGCQKCGNGYASERHSTRSMTWMRLCLRCTNLYQDWGRKHDPSNKILVFEAERDALRIHCEGGRAMPLEEFQQISVEYALAIDALLYQMHRDTLAWIEEKIAPKLDADAETSVRKLEAKSNA